MRRRVVWWLAVLALVISVPFVEAGDAQAGDRFGSGVGWLREMVLRADVVGTDSWPVVHEGLDPTHFLPDGTSSSAAQHEVVSSLLVSKPIDDSGTGLAITLVEFTHNAWAARLESGTDEVLPDDGFPGDEVLVSRATDPTARVRVMRAQFSRGRVRADVLLLDGHPTSKVSWAELRERVRALAAQQFELIPENVELPSKTVVPSQHGRVAQGLLWGAAVCLLFVGAAGVARAREAIIAPPYAVRYVTPKATPRDTHVVDLAAELTSLRRTHLVRSAMLLLVLMAVFEGWYFGSGNLDLLPMLGIAGLVLALLACVQQLWFSRSRTQQFRRVRGLRATVVSFLGILGDITLLFSGTALLAIALTGLAFVRGADPTVAAVSFIVAALVPLALVGSPGRLAGLFGRRDVERLLRADARPELLMLRSFADDRLRMRTHRTGRMGVQQWLAPRSREQYEELMAWVLWRYGPVLAVGRPGELLAPIGAARTYHSDETWQQVVTQRISSAPLILVTLGTTEGLAWELGEIRRLGALHRSLFMIPPTADGSIDDRVAVLESGLGLTPGGIPSRQGERTLLAVTFLGEAGPTCYFTDTYDDFAYVAALERAAESIVQPILPGAVAVLRR